MKEIPLTRGLVAIVDDEDFERVSGWRWRALRAHRASLGVRTWYAFRQWKQAGQRHYTYLHRVILNVEDGFDVDHRDGNGLNCQKDNLRVASRRQNLQNRRRLNEHKSSRFKGVCWDRSRSMWTAYIRWGGSDGRSPLRHLGRFLDEEAAARAYDAAAKEHFGEFASLNFE